MHHPSNDATWRRKNWATDLGLRTLGAMLLRASYGLALALHRQVAALPHGQTTLGEFALATAAFAALTSGLAFAVEGAGLFRLVPMPPRSFLK